MIFVLRRNKWIKKYLVRKTLVTHVHWLIVTIGQVNLRCWPARPEISFTNASQSEIELFEIISQWYALWIEPFGGIIEQLGSATEHRGISEGHPTKPPYHRKHLPIHRKLLSQAKSHSIRERKLTNYSQIYGNLRPLELLQWHAFLDRCLICAKHWWPVEESSDDDAESTMPSCWIYAETVKVIF